MVEPRFLAWIVREVTGLLHHTSLGGPRALSVNVNDSPWSLKSPTYAAVYIVALNLNGTIQNKEDMRKESFGTGDKFKLCIL